jgi:hypothetical protein
MALILSACLVPVEGISALKLLLLGHTVLRFAHQTAVAVVLGPLPGGTPVVEEVLPFARLDVVAVSLGLQLLEAGLMDSLSPFLSEVLLFAC